jgi:hypothetical protein
MKIPFNGVAILIILGLAIIWNTVYVKNEVLVKPVEPQ